MNQQKTDSRSRRATEEGVDIRVIQELMMHESLATTQIYAGVSARLKREGILTLPSRNIPTQSGRFAA